MALEGLSPRLLWQHFEEMTKLPHESGNEAAMAAYLSEYAQKKGWKVEKDRTGNLLVRVPASPGHEGAPVVILQGHMDMVCEKNSDVEHDFLKDPLKLQLVGDWVKASGTTLGADNAIGMAASLAAAEDRSVVHGPLELLFTVDEEVGLTGAGKIGKGWLKGRTMLNLDSEEIGVFTVGCAGGGDTTIRLPITRRNAPRGAVALDVKVAGLRGGHSGIDIHEQRGNSNRVLARVLRSGAEKTRIFIAAVNGGSKRNAIPRESEALVLVPKDKKRVFMNAVAKEEAIAKSELAKIDPGLKVTITAVDEKPAKVLDSDSVKKVLDLLLALPHGVELMSYEIAGLVETSTNLAMVHLEPRTLVVGMSTRSSVSSALEALRNRIDAVVALAGGKVEKNKPYPGWQPNLGSGLLKVAKEVHRREFGEAAKVEACHAGLECGIIGEKFGGMDMLSFGPTIQNPHSPDERVNAPSVESFWKFLVALLAELA
ncbi:MAG: aminoacyl-histidine dipeptidase [Candidatus Eisenbacteria sp.]|nr:aminoacyl-histidine dipeptidase [Candidatus Eisenbacteria bacterium]